MDKTELLKKVRSIEIKTKGLSNHIFSGEYHSAFKGRGMSFTEVREYMPGDDVRSIDWNVTARFSHPYVKVYEEERELTVMLLVDMSKSQAFGTKVRFKNELITELCAVLAFSALQNNDKVGVIFFTDKIEKVIPAKKGKSHILRIISDLLNFEPTSNGTNVNKALEYFNNAVKRRSIVFLISDFQIEAIDERPLRVASGRHDLVALQIYDERETHLPNAGFMLLKDAESGKLVYADTSDRDTRLAWESNYTNAEKRLYESFTKLGVDITKIRADMDYVPPLMTLFKNRGKRLVQ